MAKRCEIRPRLLLITNRKSHIGFQVNNNRRTSMTLKGHNGLWYVNRTILWLNGMSLGSAMIPSDRVQATFSICSSLTTISVESFKL